MRERIESFDSLIRDFVSDIGAYLRSERARQQRPDRFERELERIDLTRSQEGLRRRRF